MQNELPRMRGGVREASQGPTNSDRQLIHFPVMRGAPVAHGRATRNRIGAPLRTGRSVAH